MDKPLRTDLRRCPQAPAPRACLLGGHVRSSRIEEKSDPEAATLDAEMSGAAAFAGLESMRTGQIVQIR